MTNPNHATIVTAPPAGIRAEDIMAVLTAAPGADSERLRNAAPVLAARLQAWESAEEKVIADLRGRLRAATIQAGAQAAAHQGLREEFDRLRRAVRARVIQEIAHGTLYQLQDEVDQAFRDWGMPGLPTLYSVMFHAPFTVTVTAPNPAQASQCARDRLCQVARRVASCHVRAYDAELDPPEPDAGAAAIGEVGRYKVSGRAQVTATLRARDAEEVTTQALPLVRRTLAALDRGAMDTEAITHTGVEEAGFDPDLDPDRD
jgi:hypothetical protein